MAKPRLRVGNTRNGCRRRSPAGCVAGRVAAWACIWLSAFLDVVNFGSHIIEIRMRLADFLKAFDGGRQIVEILIILGGKHAQFKIGFVVQWTFGYRQRHHEFRFGGLTDGIAFAGEHFIAKPKLEVEFLVLRVHRRCPGKGISGQEGELPGLGNIITLKGIARQSPIDVTFIAISQGNGLIVAAAPGNFLRADRQILIASSNAPMARWLISNTVVSSEDAGRVVGCVVARVVGNVEGWVVGRDCGRGMRDCRNLRLNPQVGGKLHVSVRIGFGGV